MNKSIYFLIFSLILLVIVGCQSVNSSPVQNLNKNKYESVILEPIKFDNEKDPTIRTDIYLSYDIYNPIEFTYNVSVFNNTNVEVVVDFVVIVDGESVGSYVVGIKPFGKSYRSATMKFSEPKVHIFEAKIVRITNIMGQKGIDS